MLQTSQVKADIAKFITAGKATFTVVSVKTGKRFTYEVEEADESNRQRFFVKLLTGRDNERDYTYIGQIKKGQFELTKASKLPKESAPVLAFDWTFRKVSAGDEVPGIEVWHEGQCGRCGKKLTVPESIASGFGPECAKKLG
jgi:hypothetical protein